MKSFVRALFWIAIVTIALAVLMFAPECWKFVTRNEATAQEEATVAFASECARFRTDPDLFKGPQRIKSPSYTYGFLWKNPSTGDQIVTMTRYFPWGTESWFMKGEENAKFEAY